MAEVATLSVLLQARDKLSGPLGTMQGKLDNVAAKARKMGLAMTVMGGAITGVFALALKSSQEQQIGINRLDQALKNVGASYDGQKEAIEAVIEAQQRKTNFGDEAQRDALQKLVIIGGQWEGSLNALKITTDVAAGANIDLSAAALLVGKAIAGETSSLSRYGILLEKGATQTEIMAALTKQFGGAAEAAVNPFTQLKNRMGDMSQVLGDALLPLVSKAAVVLESVTRNIIAWTDAHPQLTKFLVIAAAAVGGLLLVLGPLLLFLPPLFAGFVLLTKGIHATTLALKGMSRSNVILLALTAAITAGILIWKNWDKIVQVFKATWDKVWPALQLAAEKGINFIIGLFNKMTFVHRQALAGMIEAAKAVLDALPGANKFGDAMQAAIDKIRAGIPTIDITADKVETLGTVTKETAVVVEKAFKGIADSATTNLSTVVKESEKTVEALVTGFGEIERESELSLLERRVAQINHNRAMEQLAREQAVNLPRIVEDAFADIRELTSIELFNQRSAHMQHNRERAANAKAAADELIRIEQRAADERMETAQRLVDSLNARFADQTRNLLFHFSEQGQAWNDLGGTANRVINNMAAVLETSALEIATSFAAMQQSGETWKDLLLRLDAEGTINLANLAEAFKALGDQVEDVGKKAALTAGELLVAGRAGELTSGQGSSERRRIEADMLQIMAQHTRGHQAGGPDAHGGWHEILSRLSGMLNALGVQGFAHGGVVPGPIGVAQMAVVHGGETIIPRGGGGGGGARVLNLTVNINSPSFEARNTIARIVREVHDGGGFDSLFRDR